MPVPAEFDNLRVLLVKPSNPLNMGAAARAMSNFGFLHFRAVDPYDVGFRTARSAVGAAELLQRAEEFPTVAEAVADCALVVGTTAVRHRDLQHPLRTLEEGARIIRQQLLSGRVALLFGSEKYGLSNEAMSHCQWLMRIPTREEHISMNLGQAVAICLYELARGAQPEASSKELEPASAGELERITRLSLESLHASGYVHPGMETLVEEKLRRMIRRLNLPAKDVELWLGMLRQILWKLRGGVKADD